jgi:hypothetical protein
MQELTKGVNALGGEERLQILARLEYKFNKVYIYIMYTCILHYVYIIQIYIYKYTSIRQRTPADVSIQIYIYKYTSVRKYMNIY